MESYIQEPFILVSEKKREKLYISKKFKKIYNEILQNVVFDELVFQKNEFLRNIFQITKENSKPIKTFLRLQFKNINNEIIEFSKIIEVRYNEKEKNFLIIYLESLEFENLFSLIEKLPLGIAIHQSSKIIYANQYTRNILNEKKPYEVIGKNINDFISPEFQAIVKERIAKVINENKEAEPLEEVFYTLDRKPFYARVSARKFLWNNEPAVLVFFDNIDAEIQRKIFLTKLISLIQNTAKSEAFTKLIKDLLESFKIVIQGNLVIVWFEGEFSEENLIGKIVDNSIKIEVFSSQSNDFHQDHISYFLIHPEMPLMNTILNKKILFEKHLVQRVKDIVLKEILYENNVKTYWSIPLLDSQKKGKGILICYFDSFIDFKDTLIEYLYQLSTIISLILEKEKIVRQNYIISEVIRNAHVAIIALDKNFEVIFYNQTIFKFFPEIFLRENFSIQFIISQLNIMNTDKDRLVSGILKKQDFLLVTETDEENEDEKKYFEFIFSRFETSKDQLLGFYLVIRETTESIKYQKELIKAKEESERNAKIKSEFISIMSHEIRTPLNVIVGISNLLNHNQNMVSREHIEILKNSSEYLLKIINNILDFSKIESKKLEIQSEKFSLKKLLMEIQDFFKFQILEKKLDFVLEMDNKIPDFIIGDSTKINQILFNVISNAVKFTEEGEVLVRIYPIHFENKEILIRFEIMDTGIGIPEEKVQYIFEPFSQLDLKPSRKIQGTGLGLAITKKLVDYLNGKISISSLVNKGTKVCIDLPFKSSEDILSSEDQSIIKMDSHLSDLSSKKVLVVEDYLPNLLITKKFLEIWKINVDTASNGEEAIYKVKNNHYDLILMDLYMPEMDGFQTSQKIREFNKQIPIIAVTASSYEEVIDNIHRSEINDIIIKPFQPGELLKKIINILK